MHDMKDSGVEWIGAVPSGYRTASIGSLFTIMQSSITSSLMAMRAWVLKSIVPWMACAD